MKKIGDPRVVLVFQASFCQTNRQEFEGIFRFGREAGWSVQTVEYAAAAGTRFIEKRMHGRLDIGAFLKFWKPSGCIIECAGRAPQFRRSDFEGFPSVFLDRHPSTIEEGALCVSSDANSIAEFAVRELLPLGFADYAYLPWPQSTVWSRERGEAFERYVEMNGKSFHRFTGRLQISDSIGCRKNLATWVSQLPKPCGVFVANDFLAEQLATACVIAKVSIPEQIAIIGVDDDVPICENAPVSLSSIRTDNERAGYIAAELLARRMEHPRARIESAVFGATGVTRRASTHFFGKADARVIKALEFIRRRGCEGIEPPNVVKEMGCSRRLADLRFREVTSHTILDEIHAVRLERVKTLLARRGQEVAAIPDLCGYASLVDLRRVFKQRTGLTMRGWQRENGLLES